MEEKDTKKNHLDEIFDPDFVSELNDLLYTPQPVKNESNPVPPSTPVKAQFAKKAASAGKKDKQESAQSVFLGYLHDISIILAVLLLVFPLLFRVVQVYGTSMNKTLYEGDYLLLLSNTFYRNPKYGDVIVASKHSFEEGTPIIKRVIATENQVVDIDFDKGIVYVDGVALDEPYTMSPTNLSEGEHFPQVVREGCVFVMGDNRNASKDSRSPQIGQIDKREIVGKVLLLLIPGSNDPNSALGLQPFDIHRIGVVQ